MSLRNLQIFIEVAECGNMTETAKKLYITQSSVSQAIAELEKVYGVRLFERLSKRIYLTREGQIMLNYGRKIFALFDEMKEDLTADNNLKVLRIGATITAGSYVMNDLVHSLQGKLPQFISELSIDYSNNLILKLLQNNLDICLIEGNLDHSELISLPIIKNRLVIICGKKHPFFESENIQLKDLNQQPFVVKETGSRIRTIFEKILHGNHIFINEQLTSNNSTTLIHSVINYPVLSYLSEIQVKDEIENNLLRIIEIPELTYDWNINVIYHKNKHITPVLNELLKHIQTDIGN